MLELEGLRSLVTGGAGAIGSELVIELLRHGAAVTVLSPPGDQGLERLVLRLANEGLDAAHVMADIASFDQVASAVDASGGVDVLVNNAGVFDAVGAMWELDPASWALDVHTNLIGTFNVIRACLPEMLTRGSGTIVNVVGGGFDRPNPGGTSYAASKAGVARLTDTLAAELDAQGADVFVHGLMPGLVRSAMTDRLAQTRSGQQWLPHVGAELAAHEDVAATDVAGGIVRLIERAHELPNGRVLRWDDDIDALIADSAAASPDRHQIRWIR